MPTLHKAGGVATGTGGTVALRVTMDEPGGDRFMQPSVLYGLGTGGAAGLLEVASLMGVAPRGVRGNMTLRDFLRTHAASALVAGGVSAALPKAQETTQTASPSVTSFFSNRRRAVSSQRHENVESGGSRGREASNGTRRREGRSSTLAVEGRR